LALSSIGLIAASLATKKGQAQIFLDRLFQSFGLQGSLEVGGSPEFGIKGSRIFS
jgi:hypothetical protein